MAQPGLILWLRVTAVFGFQLIFYINPWIAKSGYVGAFGVDGRHRGSHFPWDSSYVFFRQGAQEGVMELEDFKDSHPRGVDREVLYIVRKNCDHLVPCAF